MSAQSETVWTKLSAIVGADFLRPASPADMIDGVLPQMVVEPGSANELARVLAHAKEVGLFVVPRGNGTKLDWGNPPHRADLILSTKRLNRVVEHAWGDMTATVEAGCTVADFQHVLAEHNQRLALDPLWPAQSTIGGILATNDSGALRIRFGSLRDLIIGITVALPDGTLAKSGGKVVKNVAGYDLPKLFTGSLGTLGVITEATFRLYPLPRATQTLCFTTSTSDEMSRLVLAIQDSTLVTTGLQIVVEETSAPRICVRLESVQAAIESQAQHLIKISAQTGAEQVDVSADEWNEPERLWQVAPGGIVCKISVLPTQLGQLCEGVRAALSPLHAKWKLIAQGFGVSLLRMEHADEKLLLDVLDFLHNLLKQLDGSVVVLSCPLEIKKQIDVWGDPGDTLPLMRRIKEQFDPSGTLNPGRFVRGI
ncbi:MAG: FAD-binding oxidoreductase [Pyrinomonadaceae bacterium]|nr:FAD-binding oxidoreductase [Pyrinomonadaceae bacterium]